jgi:hypothetical protein
MPRTLSQLDRSHDILWRFDTAQYTVAFWAEPEDMSPEDHFCDERDIAFAREDDPAHWFCAFVGVFKGENDDTAELIGYDCLGGCSYNSFREFYSSHRWYYSRRQQRMITDNKSRAWKTLDATARKTGRKSGSYFCDMVRQAIREARQPRLKL